MTAPHAIGAIDLGTCVRVSMTADLPPPFMIIDGVVREVVAPGDLALTDRVQPADPVRAPIVRYVVQCKSCRLLRAESEMVVVCQ